jgi:aarF domain-containing kinase
MRLAFILGRFCRRPGARRDHDRVFEHIWTAAFRQPSGRPPRRWWQQLPSHGLARTTLRATAKATLGTAAFVKLSQEDNEGTEHTGETRMLEVSRHEIQKKLHDDGPWISRLGRNVVIWLDLYVWEPICTGVRFLHLVAIFVPVIIAVPAIWIGRRQKDRDNERSGTLWWYGFLVKSMEWAGPAFIKVGDLPRAGGEAAPAA